MAFLASQRSRPDGSITSARSSGYFTGVTDLLMSGDTWESQIIDCQDFNAISLELYADQPIDIINVIYGLDRTTILEEFSRTVELNINDNTKARDITSFKPRSRYFKIRLENNSGQDLTLFSFNIRLYVEEPPAVIAPLNLPIRDGSTAVLNRSVLTGRDSTGTYQNVIVNSSNVLVTSNFDFEVSRGIFSDIKNLFKFGKTPMLTNTQEGNETDFWNGSGDYPGFPVGINEQVTVVSTNLNDTALGTGARTIEIFGLDENGLEQNETLTLNGLLPVTSVNTYSRIFRGIVRSAGTLGGNVGVISCIHLTTVANVFFNIEEGANQTEVAAYTIPADKIGILRDVDISIARGNGSQGGADCTLRIRENGEVFRTADNYNLSTGSGIMRNYTGGLILKPLTDIKLRNEKISDNNTRLTGSFQITLINNT